MANRLDSSLSTISTEHKRRIKRAARTNNKTYTPIEIKKQNVQINSNYPIKLIKTSLKDGHGTWWHNKEDKLHNLDENGVWDPDMGNIKWQDAYGHEEVFDKFGQPVRDHNGTTFNRYPGNKNPLHLYDIFHWERNGTGWPDDHSTRETRCVIFC